MEKSPLHSDALILQRLPSMIRQSQIALYLLMALFLLPLAIIVFYLFFPYQGVCYSNIFVKLMQASIQGASEGKWLWIEFGILCLVLLLVIYQYQVLKRARLIIDQDGIRFVSNLPGFLQGLSPKLSPRDWAVSWPQVKALQIKRSDFSKIDSSPRFIALKVHAKPQPPEIFPYQWIAPQEQEIKPSWWQQLRLKKVSSEELEKQILLTPLMKYIDQQKFSEIHGIPYLIDSDLDSLAWQRSVWIGMMLVLVLFPAVSLYFTFNRHAVNIVEATPALKAQLQAPNRLLQRLNGHTHNVLAVAFSPDGKLLASGDKAKQIIVWEVATHQKLRTLQGHTDKVHALTFTPDNAVLISGSEDNTIKFWDIQTGALQRTLDSPKAVSSSNYKGVYALAISPDGTRLASANWDGGLSLWAMPEGRLLQTMDHRNQGHADSVNSLAFSVDGRLLASGGFDNLVKLWRVENQQLHLQHTLQGHSDWVFAVALSPDGKRLASGANDRKIILWNLAVGRAPVPITTIKGHGDAVVSLSFRNDSKVLASGSDDFRARLWSVENGTMLASLEEHHDYVNALAFSPNGKLLATGSGDNTVMLWHYQ